MAVKGLVMFMAAIAMLFGVIGWFVGMGLFLASVYNFPDFRSETSALFVWCGLVLVLLGGCSWIVCLQKEKQP
jgi:hypothetical protein